MERHTLILCIVAAIITGCTGKNPQTSKDRSQAQDTAYTQEAAMKVYDYDPVRALRIVDSAVIVGNMSDWQADKNRARIYSQTRLRERLDSLMHWPADARLDSARAIGERLLRHDSVRNRLEEQQDVLEILAYTARLQEDSLTWLQRSRQLVEVCRRQGAETEALRNEAEVGAALCRMGQPDAGMAKLDSVIDKLQLENPFRFNELDALVIALKRKIGVMTATGQAAEILPLARRIVTVLDDYEQHPDRYHDGTYREPTADRREDYIRFYRTLAENFIATAYADLGKSGDMQATFERLENIIIDAETREHLARYHALEQQMEAKRQKARANSIRLQAVGIFIIALMAICFVVVVFRKNRNIRQKNRILAQQLTELYDNTRPEEIKEFTLHSSLNAEDLYHHIRDEVIRLQLYTDPGFGRQSVIERFHLTKDQAGRVFSQGSEHNSISAFINECRLDHARRLLISRPDMSIADIATASGFGVRTTFTRSFKAKYGLTPTEFREQQEQS